MPAAASSCQTRYHDGPLEARTHASHLDRPLSNKDVKKVLLGPTFDFGTKHFLAWGIRSLTNIKVAEKLLGKNLIVQDVITLSFKK